MCRDKSRALFLVSKLFAFLLCVPFIGAVLWLGTASMTTSYTKAKTTTKEKSEKGLTAVFGRFGPTIAP